MANNKRTHKHPFWPSCATLVARVLLSWQFLPLHSLFPVFFNYEISYKTVSLLRKIYSAIWMVGMLVLSEY